MKTKTPLPILTSGVLCVGIGLVIWIVALSHGFSGENIDSKTYETPLKPLPASLNLPYICRNPQPDDYRSMINKGAPLTNLSKFNPKNPFSVDLRSADVSRLDLRDSAADLEHANYDSQTIWPPKDRMPPAFDAGRILELGKNPGLGVRGLHAQGITGRGIGIGIVDQALLTRHSEYAGRIKWYEEINVEGWRPSEMHGPAVASIAVGKTVGVAPEADLYYIAVRSEMSSSSILHNHAQGVRRLLEVNRRLPKEHRIRAISLSIGYGPGTPGYEDFISAVKEAEAEGIFVAWCGNERFPVDGLGVSPSADRDDFNACVIPQRYQVPASGSLFVPMDSRTTASPTGVNDYVFYGPGGKSWTVPYAAGAYALAA
jgi:subtilisin family serine protease